MSRWIYLSHFLDAKTPAYGGGESFRIEQLKSMARGDSCNAARWCFSNHLGTHIDFPRHFMSGGKTLEDYAAGFWVYRFVHLMDISPVSLGGVIGVDDIDIASIPRDTEMLILKSGFGALRDRPEYWEQGLVFLPEIAGALRKVCPMLRIVGFDTISLSSWASRSVGRETHRAFLAHENPILPLEDMNLEQVEGDTAFSMGIVSPLVVTGADASPCTVFAEVTQ